MADLAILPGALNLSIYRGDDSAFQVTITEGGTPKVLPTSGWAAQVRQRAGESTDPALAAFTVDATDAATGVIRLSIADADTLPLPRKCKWDLQLNDSGAVHTYLAGDLNVTEQVTQP